MILRDVGLCWRRIRKEAIVKGFQIVDQQQTDAVEGKLKVLLGLLEFYCTDESSLQDFERFKVIGDGEFIVLFSDLDR